MTSKNIGDLLNAANIPWGSFMGGFNLQTINNNGTTGCARSTVSQVVGGAVADYIPHHAWFQYYASTANPTHARPTSTKAIGYTTVPGTKNGRPGQPRLRSGRLHHGGWGRQLSRRFPSSRCQRSRTVTRATPIRSTSRREWSL